MILASSDLAAFEVALAHLERDGQTVRWRGDPAGWVRDRLKGHVWSKQVEIMASVIANERTAVPSCNGSGKSQCAAWVVAHFIATNEPGTAFVFTTAPRSQQVRAILWRYIRRAHKKAGLNGRINHGMIPEWYIDGELVGFGRKPADVDADTVMGLHEHKMLIVLDEADGINKELWSSIESLMTNDAGCSVLAIGNPLDNSSHFARICDGTEPGWNIIRISAFDTPAMTGEPVPQEVAERLVSRRWIEDKAIRWGVRNPLYIGKVLGRHPDSEDGLIPMSWVRAANARWEAWDDAGRPDPPGVRVYGVDVGHMGEDNTCIATRQGDVVMSVESWSQRDTVAVTGLVEARLSESPRSVAMVDAIGVGAGVVDLLRAHHRNVVPFVASAATKRRDSTGTQGFPNLRSASLWNMRELLNPALGATLALPPDDDLSADLTTPKQVPITGGKIAVESKDSIRKRLGRSTDAGDSVAIAMWYDPAAGRVSEDLDAAPRGVRYADAISWT